MECPFSSKICISEDVFALKARPSSYLVHGFYEKLFDLQQVVLDGNAQAAVINVNCDSISNYTVRTISQVSTFIPTQCWSFILV